MQKQFEKLFRKDLILADNVRNIVDSTGLQLLADSIKKNGILQPLMVRKVGEKYEVITGKRRFLASEKVNVNDLPCYIMEISDSEVEEIQMIENIQREGVHPMDEAIAFDKLIKDKNKKPEDIASKIGQSVSYVLKRRKLIDLHPDLQKSFLKGKMELGHAMMLARIPKLEQLKAVEKNTQSWNDNKLAAISQLHRWIEQNLFLEIKGGGFDPNDANLFPQAGACAVCPKRTINNKGLFDDVGDTDVCTDGECFRKKQDLHIKAVTKKLEEKNEKVLSGSPHPYSSNSVTIKGADKKDISVNIVPKTTLGAVPVVLKGKTGNGKVVYVPGDLKNPKDESAKKSPQQAAKEKKEREVREKCRAFRFHLYKLLAAKIIAAKEYAMPKEMKETLIDDLVSGNFYVDFEETACLIFMAFGKFTPTVEATDFDKLQDQFSDWVDNKKAKTFAAEHTKVGLDKFFALGIIANDVDNASDVNDKSELVVAAKALRVDYKAEKKKFTLLFDKQKKEAEKKSLLEKAGIAKDNAPAKVTPGLSKLISKTKK